MINPTLVVHEAAGLPWIPVPGVGGCSVKILRVDVPGNEVVFLAKLVKGARFPRHLHHARTFVWTLSGSWRYDDVVLREGSLGYEAPGLEHEASSDEDCLVLVVMVGDGPLMMSGWAGKRQIDLDVGFFEKARRLGRVAELLLGLGVRWRD